MRHKLVHLTLKKKSKLTEEVGADPAAFGGRWDGSGGRLLELRAPGGQAAGQRGG